MSDASIYPSSVTGRFRMMKRLTSDNPTLMTDAVALADWLDDLAAFGTPERFYESETAHHLSQVIKYWHRVKLAIESRTLTR